MPGIYSSPIDQLIPQLIGGGRQASMGVDSDWTNLAMMYGFRPNPFGDPNNRGQEEIRFLSTLKNIMDQQFQGYGPNADVQRMPNYMYNQFAGMAPLYASPAANDPGFGPAPAGAASMFQGGQYQPGPLPSNQSPLIQQYLSRLQSAGSGTGSTISSVAGGNTVAQNQPVVSGPPNAASQAQNAALYANSPASAAAQNSQGAGRATIAAALAQPNNPAAGATGAQPFTGQSGIQPQSRRSEQDNPNYTQNAQGMNTTGGPGLQLGNARDTALQAGYSNIGNQFSGMGTGVDQLAAAIVRMLMGVRG